MTDFGSKVACVVDSGLFAEFAVTLARSFGKVYLYVPWESNPSSNQLMIGQGLEGVTKADHWAPILNEVDLWVFPDVYYGPLQVYLASIGKRVWGSRMGEELELFRTDAKKHFKKLGLDVGPYTEVHGIDDLREYLADNEDVWIKISRSRGDFETFHSESYRLIEPYLDLLEYKLGAKKNSMTFVVEDAIPDAVEIGYDGYCIDGQFPRSVMAGIEVKDRGYVGVFKDNEELPKQMKMVNTRLAQTLKGYNYRNFWAVELRVDRDGTPWVIDPCCRAGSPPSQLSQLMYTNMAEIMWYGADGELVDPVPRGKWGALVLILSDHSDRDWQVVEFPEKIRENVKLHFPVMISGRYWIVPQKDAIIGAVVATGNTMKAAINEVRKLASEVQGHGLEIQTSALDEAQGEFANLTEFGVTL